MRSTRSKPLLARLLQLMTKAESRTRSNPSCIRRLHKDAWKQRPGRVRSHPAARGALSIAAGRSAAFTLRRRKGTIHGTPPRRTARSPDVLVRVSSFPDGNVRAPCTRSNSQELEREDKAVER